MSGSNPAYLETFVRYSVVTVEGMSRGGDGSCVDWRGGVAVYQWGGVGHWGGVSGYGTTTTSQNVSIQMGSASGYDFRGVSRDDWHCCGADWKGIGSHAVAESISNVVGGNHLTIGSHVAVGADFVSGSILDGVVSLEGFGMAVGGFSQAILGVVLSFFYGRNGNGVSDWSGSYGVSYWRGDGMGYRGGSYGVRISYRCGDSMSNGGRSYTV